MEDMMLNNREYPDEFFDKVIEKREIKNSRFDRFEKWLENNDFDNLLYRIILEHDDEYRSKCYENGYEPYSNNKMSFIFDYVIDRAYKVNPIGFEVMLTNSIYEFKCYYFQIIWGQGVILKIYNKEDGREIFTI